MIKKITKDFLRIVQCNFATLILFELFHKLIAMLMMPAFKYVMNLALRSIDIRYLDVENMQKAVTNPLIIAVVILILIVTAFYILFEFISLIIAFNESAQGRKIGLIKLIKVSSARCMKIFKLKNILLLLFVLLIIPSTNLNLTSTFIEKIKLPGYIQDFISSSSVLNLIYMAIMLVLYVLVIRWIFSIHEVALYVDTFKKAKKNSISLTKGRYLKLILISVSIFILSSVLGYVLHRAVIIFIGFWTRYITGYFINGASLKRRFITSCMLFDDYVIAGLMIFNAIFNIAILSTLYYKYKNIEVKKHLPQKQQRSLKKSLAVGAAMLVLFQIEATGFSYLSENDSYNTAFLYNTMAIGHRMAAGSAPENTLSSLQKAIESGAEYVELDVQETRDGKLIIYHDFNFKRITGVNKNVWEADLEEVKTYDAGSYFSADFAGETIPTLEEVIEAAKGKVKLLIEIKLSGHENGDVTKEVIDLIKENKIDDECIIASMDKSVLARVKELDKSIETCYITAIAYGNLYNWDFVDIYSIESTFVNKDSIYEVHNNGKEIYAWTINNSKLVDKMIELNVDGIITDNPYLVADSIERKKNGFISKVANILF